MSYTICFRITTQSSASADDDAAADGEITPIPREPQQQQQQQQNVRVYHHYFHYYRDRRSETSSRRAPRAARRAECHNNERSSMQSEVGPQTLKLRMNPGLENRKRRRRRCSDSANENANERDQDVLPAQRTVRQASASARVSPPLPGCKFRCAVPTPNCGLLCSSFFAKFFPSFFVRLYERNLWAFSVIVVVKYDFRPTAPCQSVRLSVGLFVARARVKSASGRIAR